MEQKILIEFIPEIKGWKLVSYLSKKIFKKEAFPIQGKPFSFSLKITNIDDKVFPGAIIKNLSIDPANKPSEYLNHPFDREFSIQELNPNQSVEIPIARLRTLLDGLVWVKCSINPKKDGDKISAYQKDPGTGENIDPKTNRWGQEFIVLPQSQVSLDRTNNIIIILTILTFVEGVWGMRKIAIGLANFLGKILSIVASSLMSIK